MIIDTTPTQKVEAEGQTPLFFTFLAEAQEAFDFWRRSGKRKIRRSMLKGTQWECVEFTVS